ncbi:MAG: D-glycero-beta-D-manno-heptose 1,7-bisphosphate 7-phosphatase [Planctomycetes bacterium]|nr:D-glycero-beta-D-manno-heptose 1,7-bisphosphate 7-phosphatase [Planctomycetota bacterium]HPF14384.1 D-glycero-beta-D-manno-heptose 1,7-bisphosphate 7-phosphatase [Planctomycetota bacterium]
MSRKAVFLDRDGTLNREVHYLADPDRFEWLPGVLDALHALQAGGWALVVVTNQSGIAQGLVEVDDLDAIHARMRTELASAGVTLAGIYSCPHHPHIGRAPWVHACECRKPAPGMLLEAQRDLDLDLAESWMIGDSLRDLQAGWAAGCRSILVRTGKGREQEAQLKEPLERPAWVAEDLLQAAQIVLAQVAPAPNLGPR